MRSAISFLSCIAGLLAFTAVTIGRPIGTETFDRGALTSSWIQTTAASLQYTGGADGARGFASLSSQASRLEGALATPDQLGGVADFSILRGQRAAAVLHHANVCVGGAALRGRIECPGGEGLFLRWHEGH